MNFANYAEFRTQLHQLIDGDDVSVSDLSADTLDLLVSLGEQRLYREVRSSAMDAALSVTITANAATLPSDLIELRSVYVSGEEPIQLVTYEQYLQYTAQSPSAAIARFAARVGDTLVFWPSQTGTLLGRYYKKFSDIADGITSNTLFARHPDLFMFAALAESAPVLGDSARLAVWEAKYANIVKWVNREENTRAYGASTLAVRVA